MTTATNKYAPFTPQKYEIEGVELFLQMPLQSAKTVATSVMLLFHGCTHDGDDWFLYPEERIIVNHMLSNYPSMAIIAISSQERTGYKCFSGNPDPSLNVDVQRISKCFPRVLDLMVSTSANKKPDLIYAFGVSSGANLLPILMTAVKFDGLISQISASPEFKKRLEIPPTAFVYMTEDIPEANAIEVSNLMDDLKDRQPKLKGFSCEPKFVTAVWLYQKMESGWMIRESSSFPGFTLSTAESIVNVMEEQNMLEIDTGELMLDPRTIQWDVLQRTSPFLELEDVIFASIRVLLNVAYAKHEVTSEHVGNVLDFIVGLERKVKIRG